jgi:IclR family acetate operon transcriptional repressor
LHNPPGLVNSDVPDLDPRSARRYAEGVSGTAEIEVTDGAPRRSGPAGVQATLGVLELLVSHGALTLAELARQLGLPKSTLHRVCSVLADRAWVVRDDAGRYELGIRALATGSRTYQLPIVVAYRSVAAELLTRHDETVCLAVVDGDDSVLLAVEETSQPVRFVTHPGKRAPAFASASGRVILASRPREHLVGDHEGRPLVTPTGRRLNGLAELRAILDDVRQKGFAENVEETAAGLYAVSVPIVNAEEVVVAALTICAPTSRITPERRVLLVTDLRAAGRRLSESVAWLAAFTARTG